MEYKSGLQFRIRESYTQGKEDFDPELRTHLLLTWTSSGIWWWKLHSCFHRSVGGDNPNVLCRVTTRKSTNGWSQDVARPSQTCFGGFRKVNFSSPPFHYQKLQHLHLPSTRFGPPNYTEHSNLKPNRVRRHMVDPSSSEWPALATRKARPAQNCLSDSRLGWMLK